MSVVSRSQLYVHARGLRLIARHYVVNGKLREDNRLLRRGEHVAQEEDGALDILLYK